MKRWFYLLALIILVVLLIFGVYHYHIGSEKNVAEIPVTTELDESAGISRNSIDFSGDSELDDQNAIKTPSNIDPDHPSAPNYNSQIAKLLENALSGDIDAALKLNRKRANCRDSWVADFNAKRQQEFFAKHSDSAAADELVKKNMFIDSAETRKTECQFLYAGEPEDTKKNPQATANRKILDQLDDAAEQGNVMARFMFAMWRPSDREAFLTGAAIAEYERLAMTYTIENMIDQPGLALYTLGVSYSGNGYFTTKRSSLGFSYLMAATLCGLDTSYVEIAILSAISLRKFEDAATGREQTSEEEILVLAEFLASKHCPESSPGL